MYPQTFIVRPPWQAFILRSSTHLIPVTLEKLLDTFGSVEASHKMTLDGIMDFAYLYDHAIARRFSHPGIDKFRRMTNEEMMRPFEQSTQYHGWKYGHLVTTSKALDKSDEVKVIAWINDVDQLIGQMKTCQEKLRKILDDAGIKDFVAMEREDISTSRR